MKLALVSKLCEACDKSKLQVVKLKHQIEIEKIRHHVIIEAQGEGCGCDNEDCEDGYEYLSQQLVQMEFACSDCDGKSPYVAIMINEWMSEERHYMREAQEEADELMAPENNPQKAKVLSLKKALRKKEMKILH